MKKMKLIVVLLLVGLLVLGCTGNYVKEPETIKLGSILILTGQGAAWGEAARNGIEMAVEDVNNDGGVLGKQIEFVHQDDQSEAKKSVSAFYQLVDAMNIDIIIGTTW